MTDKIEAGADLVWTITSSYKYGALLAKNQPGVLNPFVLICGFLLYCRCVSKISCTAGRRKNIVELKFMNLINNWSNWSNALLLFIKRSKKDKKLQKKNPVDFDLRLDHRGNNILLTHSSHVCLVHGKIWLPLCIHKRNFWRWQLLLRNVARIFLTKITYNHVIVHFFFLHIAIGLRRWLTKMISNLLDEFCTNKRIHRK